MIRATAYGYRPAKKARPEQALQIAVMRFLDLCLPPEAIAFHVPNGGGRSKAEAGIFKAMGVKAGVPDIIIFWNGHTYALELKAGRGNLTPAQHDMHHRLLMAGVRISTQWSVDGAELQLGAWGIPLRATIVARAAA